jgi:ribosomal protein L29
VSNIIKELNTKTSQELAVLVFRLKLQLLEFRFKKQAGQLEKSHLTNEVKKTIAKAMTILKSRNVDISIGTHGLTMYDRKANTVTSLNKEASEVINATNKAVDEATNSKANKKSVDKEVETILGVEDNLIKNQAPAKKIVKSSQVKTRTAAIRKTQGGSN